MKAIVFKQPGKSTELIIREQPKPNPRANEILIQVKASAINRTDLITRYNKSRHKNFPILGVEVAGIVKKSGKQANIKPGERVMGLVNGGGYAEYAVMPADRAITIPKNMSFEEAAAIPEVFLTAYQTLFWKGKLAKNEIVLIHAGGSGVGTAAIQLAKKISQAKVITTAGSLDKLNYIKKLGADFTIHYKKKDFADKVLQITNNRGVNVILDFVGASYWNKNFRSIAVDGRWVLIGLLGGAKVENVDLWKLMAKRIQLIGTLLTPRSDSYKSTLSQEFSEKVIPLFESKKIKPVIDSIFTFKEIEKAHEYMRNNKNIGKIILHP